MQLANTLGLKGLLCLKIGNMFFGKMAAQRSIAP
jgi:hypothetical protein